MSETARITLPRQFTLKTELHDDIPFLWGEIDGSTGLFIYDSGGQDLILNARYLDLEKTEAGLGATGATGHVSSVHTHLDSVRFGEWAIENLEVMAIDLQHLEEEFKLEIRGILGFRHMIHYDWMLDYANGLITFWDRVRKEDLDILHRHRVQYMHHLPSLILEIGGNSLRFLVDTGCAEVLIDRKWREELDAEVMDMVADQMMSASTTKADIESGMIRGFRLGELEFGPNKVKFSDLSHMFHIGAFDGIIGYPLLSKYRVVQSWSVSNFYFLRD